MAKNDYKVGDNPKLAKKLYKDGNFGLYLDYYLGRMYVLDAKTGELKNKVQRKRESLKLYLYANPRTPIEREQNRQTWELAKKIRFEKEQEFKETATGYRIKRDTNINFLNYFQSYIKDYTKKDVKMIILAYRRFKDFLTDTPEYNKFKLFIKPSNINKDMIVAFKEYLQSRSKGEGARSIFARFKKVVKHAYEHDIFLKNPCDGVTIKTDENILAKEVLSIEEIKQLLETENKTINPNIRRAFIFCLYTGLRFCDVRDLTFANVDNANKLLTFEQNKTKGHSANSGVVIPLNDALLNVIGTPTNKDNRDERIFLLPSYEMCLKSLKRWVKSAGIEKHISWHCARHSFAVNILNSGANIKTVSSLLGHSGLKCTEKYTRVVDKLKEDAINSLPTFNL